MSVYSVSVGGGGVGGRNHSRRKRERERERALGPGDYLKNIASTRTGGLENRRTMRLSGACNMFFTSLFISSSSSSFFFSFLFLSTVFFFCKQNGPFLCETIPGRLHEVAIETGRETGEAARERNDDSKEST